MNVNLLQIFGLLLTSMGDAQAQNQQLLARIAQLEREVAALKAPAAGAAPSSAAGPAISPGSPSGSAAG